MNSPILNILVFVVAAGAAVALFAPRIGLVHNVHGRRREANRIRLEDTLKHVYDHEYRGETATLASVTDGLRIASAPALALVERMQQAGLVTVVDGRILLTGDGRKYALQVIRAHRLWERYLADETGVDPVRWHVEAHRREHSLTLEQADELSKRLGNPRFDPHGDPIPTSEGEVPEDKVVPVTQLDVGDSARVVHIEDEPDAVYAQLLALGVYVGMELRVEAKSDDRIIAEAEGGRKLVLAPMVAANLSIQRIAEQEMEDLEKAQETLAGLRDGEAAEVARISPACLGLERRRLMDLGILPGTRVEYDRRGMTGGLTAYRVRGTVIALRQEQADMISIHNKERLAS
jgi:DtxR family Mn-dependent transcriptional regulator